MRFFSLSRIIAALSLAMKSPPEILRVAQQLTNIYAISDHKERYEAQFNILSRLSKAWGFHLYNRHSMWQDEEAFWNTWQAFPKWEGQRPERKFVVWTFAHNTSRLEGDTAECGVFEGASSHLICAAYAKNKDHCHHVFDSFQGLSQPNRCDEPVSKTAPQWQGGDLSISLSTVKANLSKFNSIKYYSGWIPERFSDIANKKFSFVHIDVDLYQPTKDSIEFFYPRLVKGGILLCDDYGSHQCMGARRAFDEYVESKKEQSVIHLPTQQGFIIKN